MKTCCGTFVVVSVLLTLSTNAFSEAFDIAGDKDLQNSMRKIINDIGANCPVPLRVERMGEDIRGKIEKVDCASKDGKSTWSLRVVYGIKSRSAQPW